MIFYKLSWVRADMGGPILPVGSQYNGKVWVTSAVDVRRGFTLSDLDRLSDFSKRFSIHINFKLMFDICVYIEKEI